MCDEPDRKRPCPYKVYILEREKNPVKCVEQRTVYTGLDILVEHNSCEKFCCEEEQILEKEVTAEVLTLEEALSHTVDCSIASF